MVNFARVYPELPQEIETEIGRTTLGIILSHYATKEYLCPLCDEAIELGEQHILAVPIVADSLRRHLHAECLSEFLTRGLSIKLHPNESNAIKYHI